MSDSLPVPEDRPTYVDFKNEIEMSLELYAGRMIEAVDDIGHCNMLRQWGNAIIES